MNSSGRVQRHVQRTLLKALVGLPAPLVRLAAGAPVRSPEGYELDVEAQILLRAAEATGRRELSKVGVRAAREEMEGSTPIVDYQGVPGRSADRTIPGPRGPVPVRIYHPRARHAPRPVLVYFHGGGFVVGSIASHDGVCRALAHLAGVIVVSVDYALAPEHRFPAGVDDALAATRWVIAEAESFGGDPNAVAVGGDSAGGNLAAVVAQVTRADARRPVFQLLVYPATDLTRSFPSHRLFREGFMLTKESIDWYLGNYLNDDREQTDPRGSPLFAPDLRGLPRALVLTAGFDPLRDEGDAYAAKMKAAGVEVEHRCITGAIHGFFSFGGVFAHAQRAIEDAAHTLGAALWRARSNAMEA